jgi:DNA-3-methyladenine glycosylase II
MTIELLSESNLSAACEHLAAHDADLARIYKKWGTPPLWAREPGFATLLNIILEQQVSLASAKACFDKLALHIGEVSPELFIEIGDEQLRQIGFSRQKAAYARGLSEAILEGRLSLERLHTLDDNSVREELTKLKGVGRWTSDVYLLMALLRPDVMPKGDIALHAAYQSLRSLDQRPGSDEFLKIAEQWAPYRSVAARLLWHYYLSEREARALARRSVSEPPA